MIGIQPAERSVYSSLFDGIRYWRAFIGSVLYSGFGNLYVDSADDVSVAVLEFSGAFVYAGDPHSPAASELMGSIPVQPLILGNEPAWASCIEQTLGPRVEKQMRWHLPAASWSEVEIETYAHEGPSGYSFRPLENHDLIQAEEVLGWEHQNHHFTDQAHFIRDGLPLGAFCPDGLLVSGTSAFARNETHIEVQVTTAAAHRRKGLALATTSRFLMRAHEKSLSVPWDAANSGSVSLAKKLGYTEVMPYPVYSLMPKEQTILR